jgi:photosystem II stability/assembly factor-like uncharacterized protein
MPFGGSGAGTVTCIRFFKENPAFGLLGHRDAGNVAHVFRTTDGGNTWEQISLTAYPTSNTASKFAFWDPNTMLAGGIATVVTDGILAVAKTARSTS